MIAPPLETKGGRPELSIWNTSDGDLYQQRQTDSLLLPCMTALISEEDKLYLYENITEQPIEFQHGDILGLFLRRSAIAMFTPYFMAKESFVAYYFNETYNAPPTEVASNFKIDNMIPLLSLHICKLQPLYIMIIL